jgi:hypothetical protein
VHTLVCTHYSWCQGLNLDSELRSADFTARFLALSRKEWDCFIFWGVAV